MTAVQPSKVDMCRLLSDQPVGAIEYIDKEVNVKEFDWDYWQLHRCEKTTLTGTFFSRKCNNAKGLILEQGVCSNDQ